jgi:hypothetical protein
LLPRLPKAQVRTSLASAGGRRLPPAAVKDGGPAKLQRGEIVLEFRHTRDVEACAVLVSPYDELVVGLLSNVSTAKG